MSAAFLRLRPLKPTVSRGISPPFSYPALYIDESLHLQIGSYIFKNSGSLASLNELFLQ